MIAEFVHWGINRERPTCRHVLDDFEEPLCRQSRGDFRPLMEDSEEDEQVLRLPVCGRCQPLARMRGVMV